MLDIAPPGRQNGRKSLIACCMRPHAERQKGVPEALTQSPMDDTQRQFRVCSAHGGWVLLRQYLKRRLPDQDGIARECSAWEAVRNAQGTGISWRFTTESARTKFGRLYPSVSP